MRRLALIRQPTSVAAHEGGLEVSLLRSRGRKLRSVSAFDLRAGRSYATLGTVQAPSLGSEPILDVRTYVLCATLIQGGDVGARVVRSASEFVLFT